MSVALILLSLAALCVGIFLWVWLCGQFHAAGWRGVVGRLALQLSGLCLIYGVLRGQPLNGVFMAVFPPLAVPQLMAFVPYRLFLSQLIWPVLGSTVLVFLLALAVRRLRDWAAGLGLLAGLVAGVVAGDQVSQTAMCETAAARGFSTFQRNGLFTSLAGAPREFQFDLHAMAEHDGAALGWSYRDMDWYVIPTDAQRNVAGGESFTCP